MTLVDERAEQTAVDEPAAPRLRLSERAPGRAQIHEVLGPLPPPSPVPPTGDGDGGALVRPLLTATLTSLMAGLLIAGIFGSWPARGTAVVGVGLGSGWVALVHRLGRRGLLVQSALPLVALALGALTLLPSGGPGRLLPLVREAVSQGRLLRPPVPFDPGWRPVLLVVVAVVSFANGWVATAWKRPRLCLVIPLPIVFLVAVSQPKDDEVVSGLLAFGLFLAAVAVLFGGDLRQTRQLGRQFEAKRAVKALTSGVVAVVALAGLARSDFLFPKPLYNPAEKPQKPKSVPLGKVRDRVLFEVDPGPGPGAITGPWRLGTIDVYDGKTWRLPPFDDSRLRKVGNNGVVDRARAGTGEVTVRFTLRDIGKALVLPGVAAPINIGGPRPEVVFDPRTDTFRLPNGTLKPSTVYTMTTASYPTATQLQAAEPPGKALRAYLEVPSPPGAVEALLVGAPQNPWDRLEHLRQAMFAVVVAAGPGIPTDVPPSKVEDLLVGSHEGSPYEIVATEALLARWAGVPARIGFGFDGFNTEDGLKTVRPKNGANWLEVYFEGYGWVPLIGSPPRAKTDLDPDPNAKYDPTILPSDDVSLDLYIAVERDDLQELYQRLRDLLTIYGPIALAGLVAYLLYPAALKRWRTRKRTRWATGLGPRVRIAVSYAEMRDWATDLNAGDPRATALEYYTMVVDDAEHRELAWLVTRAMVGDLADSVSDADAEYAANAAGSVAKRLGQAQTMQARIGAAFARASVREPYTAEVPNVRMLRLRRRVAGRGARARRVRRRFLARVALWPARAAVSLVRTRRLVPPRG